MNRRAPLLHGLPLAAVFLLVWNDHWLKVFHPGMVSGKLSDFAGLVFFPVLLEAAYATLRPGCPRGLAVLAAASVAACCVFAAVKTMPWAADAYRTGLGLLQWPPRAVLAMAHGHPLPAARAVRLCRDPSDLVALPSAFACLLLEARKRARGLPVYHHA